MKNKQTFRIENDSMGAIKINNSNYWGSQTERSIHFFSIGNELIPLEVIYALALIKKIAAITNHQLKCLSKTNMQLIIDASNAIINKKYDSHFKVHVWSTGSGTQCNMNVNEVIANICSLNTGNTLGSKNPIHPNDHVNLSQSTNDVFPTAMHIATIFAVQNKLIPAINLMIKEFQTKITLWNKIIKIGRTHMQDAVPLTLGQEFSGYESVISMHKNLIIKAITPIFEIAAGGTAIGTGINTPKNYAKTFAKNLSLETKLAFKSGKNKFALQASHDALTNMSACLKNFATALFKIANDIRIISSGPRAGIRELLLPENEPGSSIMPGKVNPTQCEALTMVCIQVIANDTAITLGNAGGILEMNVYKPLIIYNLLQSINLLSDAITNFSKFLLHDIKANHKEIEKLMSHSLMLVTALSPTIGYDKTSKLAHYAEKNNCSISQANLKLKFLDETKLKRLLNPENMLGKNKK